MSDLVTNQMSPIAGSGEGKAAWNFGYYSGPAQMALRINVAYLGSREASDWMSKRVDAGLVDDGSSNLLERSQRTGMEGQLGSDWFRNGVVLVLCHLQ